jgi:sugar lactone lactonase YvrE
MRTPDGLRSRAVLIGTCRYTSPELPPLPAVRNNIRDLKQVLTQRDGAGIRRGDCVDVLDAPDLRTVWSPLQRAADEAEDLLLVYYAGHGVLDRNGYLYLSLPDTTRNSEHFTALDIGKLREVIGESNAANRVLILDCCFSGRVHGAMGAAGPAALAAGQVEIAGTYTLTSTSANVPAHAPIGKEYTAFTGALLKTLKEGIPNGPELLTLDEIYRNVFRELRAQNAPSPERRGVNNAGDLALGINHAFGQSALHPFAPEPRRTAGGQPTDTTPTPIELPWFQRLNRRTKIVLAVVAALVAVAVIIPVAIVQSHSRSLHSGQVELPFTGLDEPNGVAVDAAGNLYVTAVLGAVAGGDPNNTRVLKLPAGSATQEVLPFTGLGNPDDVAVDAAGNLYVTDHLKNLVVKLPTGSATQVVLSFTGLWGPVGVAVDSAGIYVTDESNNRVLKLPAGSATQEVLPFTGLHNPRGVAVDPAGTLYVIDKSNNRVLKLPAGSATQEVLPFTGLNEPNGVAVDSAGNLYVTDTLNHRVLKLRVR